MRILGIDPGSHRTGWGVITAAGTRLAHVAAGPRAGGGGPLPERLFAIATGLEEVLRAHSPEAMAVETIFHARNAQSALRLGHARGVALLCAARVGVPVFEYTAGQIKQATTGRGRADKAQVQQLVRIILGCTEELGLDASDALAAAICHAQLMTSPAARLLATGRGARGGAGATPGGRR